MERYTFVRVHAREGEESAVEDALREVQGPSGEEEGCLSIHLFVRRGIGGFITFIRGGRTRRRCRGIRNCRIPWRSLKK